MNNEEIFIGPRYTAKAFGSIIDVAYADELLQNNMDEIHNIETKPEVMKAAYEKGYALGMSISNAANENTQS